MSATRTVPIHRISLIAVVVLLVTGLTAPARAVPTLEDVYGTSYGMATAGNGRLTIMIGQGGELITFRWPTATYYDQMHFRTDPGPDGRDEAYFGAAPNEGSFAGLYLQTDDGEFLTWFRDPEWTQSILYAASDNDIIRTVYRHESLGIEVVETTLVHPDMDVVGRRYTFDFSNAVAVVSAKLIHYANFAPHQKKLPFYPTEDYQNDSEHGFLTVYDQGANRFLSFTPDGENRGLRDSLLGSNPSAAEVGDFLDSVHDNFPSGIFLAVGSDAPPEGWQVGVDAEDNPDGASEDAWKDSQDGELSASLAAIDHENQAFSVVLDIHDPQPVRVYIACGHSATKAFATLESARSTAWSDQVSAAQTRWDNYLAGKRLPVSDDPQIQSFAQRTLIAIGVGTDADTKAIVASVSVQPPYHLDWPRDGSFFNYALDVAGFRDTVTQRNYFYQQRQRTSPGQDNSPIDPQGPVGSWAMNYFSDGVPGGPINWEIDQTGLILWTWWNHAQFLYRDDPQKASDYLWRLKDSVILAADLLTNCKDEATNLQCLANEDDNFTPSISIHGASTTWLGLGSAIGIAQAMGLDESIWKRWEDRRAELHAAILDNLFGDEILNDWSMWPARVFERDDPRWETQIENHLDRLEKRLIRREVDVLAYDAKATLALAYVLRDPSDPRRDRLWKVIEVLAKDLPTPTQHIGEAYGPEPDGSWTNYVSIPHLWEATLVYLSIMAFESPEILDLPEDFVLPPQSQGGNGGGSGCEIGGTGAQRSRADFWILLILAVLWTRYRTASRLNCDNAGPESW